MKKFKLNYLLVCDNAFIGENKKLSLIGIFENLTFEKLPGRHLSLAVVGNVTISESIENNISVSLKLIRKPQKKIEITFPEAVIKPEGKKFERGRRVNFIVTIGNLPFEAAGEYAFQAYLNEEKIGEVAFKVEEKK